MADSLGLYKQFVDELSKLGNGVYENWVLERGCWPDFPDNKHINHFLEALSFQDKKVLVELLEQSRSGGIHDVLAKLNEMACLDDLRISIGGTEIEHEPFGTELHYDWLARRDGQEWPDD